MSAVISKTTVDAFSPQERTAILWDAKIKGFGLRVTPAGSKAYVFQYRMGGRGTPSQRFTIGKHGKLTPDQARKIATDLAVKVALGIDPAKVKRDAVEVAEQARAEKKAELALAFEKVAERWLADYQTCHRPRSYLQAKSAVEKHLVPALRGKALPAIMRADIQAIIDGVPVRRQATRRTIYAYASILFGWAVQRDEIAESPVAKMAKPKAPRARERVLTDEELRTVWRATDALRSPLSGFYRILALTGQRREEVAAMDWKELDRSTATWVIPAHRAKNDNAHIVPLSELVIAELDILSRTAWARAGAEDADAKRWPKSGPVMTINGSVALSCYSQAKRQLDAEIAKVLDGETMTPWRVHDLRRTLATGMQRLGIRFEVTEAVINHLSGAKGGVAGIYQRHDWADEKRAALEAWSRHVANILEPAAAENVVTLNAGKKSA